MSRILKPVSAQDVKYLHQICAQYFIGERAFHIAEFNLGNTFTGNIDLLASDEMRVYLITINIADFAGALLRAFTGYRWFMKNRDFLERIYPPEVVDIGLPVQLIILSQDFPPEIPSIVDEVCSVPLGLYRYRLFGSAQDPDIFIEEIQSPGRTLPAQDEEPDTLRKRLKIQAANLSDDDIREFQHAMRG
jgi:hypothetical protein